MAQPSGRDEIFPPGHHIDDLEALSQPLSDGAQSRHLSIVRGDPYTFKTIRIPHALQTLRAGSKVLCLQPNEHATKRVGTYIKERFASWPATDYVDAWPSWSNVAADATLVYAPVKWLLYQSWLRLDKPSAFRDYQFIIFDEAHCGSKEYTLALALILDQ